MCFKLKLLIKPRVITKWSPIVITRLAEWWQMVITRDGFFCPILTQIMDSFSCSPLNTMYLFLYWKNMKKASRKLWICWDVTYMWYGDVIFTLQWRHRWTCSQCAAVCFYLSNGLVLYIGKISGNLVLLCVKNRYCIWPNEHTCYDKHTQFFLSNECYLNFWFPASPIVQFLQKCGFIILWMKISVDSDELAHEASWSGSTLFSKEVI